MFRRAFVSDPSFYAGTTRDTISNAFCNYADIEPFTEEKKKSLLLKRQGKGADFVRAVDEIIEVYENLKKQSLAEVNSGEQITEMEIENVESAKCDSSRKSPEPIVVDNDMSKEEHKLKENHDILNLKDSSGASTQNDSQVEELRNNEPVENASIPDHLRHNAVTAGTTLRKRRFNDDPQQNSQNETMSLQKSTSFSSTDALIECTLDTSQDMSREKRKIEGLVASLLLNEDDHGDGIMTRNNDTTIINEEIKLLPICEPESLTNGHLDDSVKLNGKLELPKEGVVFKKKRKPNRKRISNTAECPPVNKESDSLVGHPGTALELSKSINVECEMSLKSDGDEHLPLVKRARVRMGKTSGDEAQPSSPVGVAKRSGMGINNNDTCKTPGDGNDCSSNGTLLTFKEELSTSTENNSSLPSPRDISFWKSKKYQLKGFDLEAALPPSKRLHRALEAMSANAAETREDCADTLEITKSNGFKCSPKITSPKLPLEEDVGFVAKSVQMSESNAVITGVSKLLPAGMNEPALLSSEAKSNPNCSAIFLVTENKRCNGILKNAASITDKSVSDVSVADFEEKTSQMSSSKLAEEIRATTSEGLEDMLCTSDLVNKKESPRLHEEENNGDAISKPILDRSESDLKNNVDDDVLPPDVVVTRTIASDNKSSGFHSDEDSQARDMLDLAKETTQRLTPSDRCYSPELTPMKELIAAAQAKRFLSRSASLSDTYKHRTALSPSAVQKEDPLRHFSPPFMTSNKSSTDDRHLTLQNSGRSPQISSRLKDLSRSFSRAEASTARKAFEAFLCTLSRTKESIGRATRLAIDCAKYGIAGEVIDIIVHNLEREPNLYKRIDLFFLVDSITQCSRNQKGGAGDVYCSLIQAVLPRLVSSAAPRGSSASENRRQCMKVLRLWLERKTLPESIIRHHMREIDMLNEMSFPGGSSRRPLRTERAFNDPVREMEGMLVDEYGSNTSMQLPNLLGTNVLDDDDGSSSSSEEKSFEAVTPEWQNDLDQEKGEVQMSTEKHLHVLEDIDGELEMEDVAPCEVEVSSLCHFPVGDAISNTCNDNNSQHLPSFAPPLPEDRPPSPPPLPSSPPPFAPPSSTSQCAMPQLPSLDAVSESANLHVTVSNNNTQARQSEPVSQQPIVLNSCLAPSESLPYYAPGYAGSTPMPPPASSLGLSGAYGNFSASHPDLRSRDNCPTIVSSPLTSKPYHLQPPPPPPPPTVSNQFSYISAEAQRGQPWRNCSPFQDRFSYMPDNQRGNFHGDRGIRGPFHHEVSDGSRFPSAVHPGPGPLHSEKVEGLSASRHQYCPPREHPPVPCNGWSVPPRLSNYSGYTARPPIESPTSRAAGAPGYWRPR